MRRDVSTLTFHWSIIYIYMRITAAIKLPLMQPANRDGEGCNSLRKHFGP